MNETTTDLVLYNTALEVARFAAETLAICFHRKAAFSRTASRYAWDFVKLYKLVLGKEPS